MAKKEVYPHADKLEAYDKLIALFPDIERKGATMPYTSINGNMFSFLDKEGYLGLRLPEIEKRVFLEEHKTKLCDAHGVILKEYVLVPEKLFNDPKSLKKYFSISIKYTNTLKSK
jgi:hypothetical protein